MSINKYFAFIDTEEQLDREFDEELKKDPHKMGRETAEWLRAHPNVVLDPYRSARMARLIETLVERAPDLGKCISLECTNAAIWAGPHEKNLCAMHHQMLLNS